MESSRACPSCKKRTLVPDDVTGNTFCASCGLVQEYSNFQAHIGGINGPTGTFIRHGTAGSGTINTYKENKVYHAQESINDLMFKLGLSVQKSQDVKAMVEDITVGEYGQGDWFPIFVGACAYVVMRKDHKILPVVDVAYVVGCDVYELGRMITRVVGFTGLKLPEFDIVNAFECSIQMCPSFSDLPEDVVQRMLKQGVFLVQCLIKWFITTGRTPMPVVAAVLVFVGELNELDVKIEDVAMELHVTVSTCRRRYKELLERLVEVARVLPWGEDVTVKNISKNAPFVIQYMELKSMRKSDGKGQIIEHYDCDMEELVEDCLSKRIGYGYGFDSYNSKDCSSNYFEADSSSNLAIACQDKYQVSPESLTMIYAKYLEEVSLVKASAEAEAGIVNKRKRGNTFDFEACSEWWRGESDLSKKLILKKVLEKDVGLDAMPPSFNRGCLSKAKRQDKIKAAKLRIQRMMHPGTANSGCSNDLCLAEPEKPKKKKKKKRRKKLQVETDWEDLIIETLLLHNVKDEEIEKGHYNVLLALHVFNDDIA
ncbi:hypothetical protein ACS0TY_031466 [Phlomoides rotata]